MEKRYNWYFRGYEAREIIGDNGTLRTELVYTGDWYALDPGRRRFVLVWLTLLTAAASLSCLAMNIFPSAGGRWLYTGVACLLTLAPLLFLWIALIHLLAAGDRWTCRGYHSGYRSFGIWSVLAAIPGSATLICEVIWCCLHPEQLASEAVYLAGAAICAACLIASVCIRRRNPVQTEPSSDASEPGLGE